MVLVKTQRSKAILSVYLVLRNHNQVLLALRKNTGFFDHYYCFVAGHVEDDETAREALVREVKEEIGIDILIEDLELKNVMHRKTDRNNIDLFFECSKWSGEIENKEPEKCEHIQFFSIYSLPENIIPYIKNSLDAVMNNHAYLEEGW